MDEAERCHRLAYLAYGNLLVRRHRGGGRGPAALDTWEITGPDLYGASPEALTRAGTAWSRSCPSGTRSTCAVATPRASRRARPAVRPGPAAFTRIAPGLEDVFISLMDRAKDNFGSWDHVHRFTFHRLWAVVIKEFIQMRRDRVTFAMMIGIPLLQLILFGFAINSDPKHLPSAFLGGPGSLPRTLVATLQNSGYFDVRAASPEPRPRPSGCSGWATSSS